MLIQRIVTIFACTVIVALGFGCERKPAKQTTVAPPAAKADEEKSDRQALSEFLNKDSKTSGASPSGLPTGHPPISGAAPEPSPDDLAALPPGHPPITAAPRQEPRGAATGAAELKFDAPENWKPQPLTSPMRKAHYILPRAEGDARDAELLLFYFGMGEGGTVQANLDRWKGMFVGADGGALPKEASTVESFDVEGLKVTLLNVTGRYVESNMMMGTQSPPTDSDFRMTAAVVETPIGPWFFRAVGPAATMSQHETAMREMLKTVRQ